jgi:hypothetical protein
MAKSPETAMAVLDDIASGLSVKAACDRNGVGEKTFYQWAAGKGAPYQEFTQDYARATLIRAERMADEILAIADDTSQDTAVDEDGDEYTRHEHIQRSKLRVDTRKWLMAKMMPKKYGDRVVQEHTGADGGPLQVVSASDKEVLAHFIRTRGKDYDDDTESDT